MPAATSAAPSCEAGRNTITNFITTIITIDDEGDDSDDGDDGDDADDCDTSRLFFDFFIRPEIRGSAFLSCQLSRSLLGIAPISLDIA